VGRGCGGTPITLADLDRSGAPDLDADGKTGESVCNDPTPGG